MEASYFVSVPAVQLDFPGTLYQHSLLFSWLCTTAQSIEVNVIGSPSKETLHDNPVAVHKIGLQLGQLKTAKFEVYCR